MVTHKKFIHKILTETMGMRNEFNPFYKAKEIDIKDNLQFAEECYYKIMDSFKEVSMILQVYELGLIKDISAKYVIENADFVLDTIEKNIDKIKPLKIYKFYYE